MDEPDAIVFTPAVDPRHYDDTEFTEETHGAKTQTGARLQGCKMHPVRIKSNTATFCKHFGRLKLECVAAFMLSIEACLLVIIISRG